MFTKYKSIPKTYEVTTLEYYKANGFTNPDVFWYVTEKVHGANYSFIWDNESKEVKHAQRSCILGGNESLFNSRAFSKVWEEKTEQLGIFLNENVQIITEIYGKGVTKSPYIPYTNDDNKYFVAYDLMVDGKFVAQTYMVYLFEKFNIPYLPVLYFGCLSDCLNFTKPTKSGLASLSGIDTDSEGVVYKPMIPIYTTSGERVILKEVFEKFQENKLSPTQLKEVQQKKEASKIFETSKMYIENSLTDMRVSKVASKFGYEPIKENFKNILDALIEDIKQEVFQEYGIEIDVKPATPMAVPFVKKFIGL